MRSRLSLAVCLLYVGSVLGFFLLRVCLPYWALVALINSVLPFLFAPLPLALAVALLIRSRMVLAGSLIVLGLFLGLYGPVFLPKARPALASDDSTFKVMTFNLRFDQPRPEQAVKAIADEEADIVAVQELVPGVAELLRAELDGPYPYLILRPDVADTGLLSRYPILSSEWFYPAGADRKALYAKLDVNGTALNVLVFHPAPPGFTWSKGYPRPTGFSDKAHERQVADIAQRAVALEGPVLVLGDFNMSDQGPAYARLSKTLKDAYREAGWGFGFTFPRGLTLGRVPLPGPLVRIDYVFYSGDLYAEQAWVGCGGGSDHCYVMVRFRGSP